MGWSVLDLENSLNTSKSWLQPWPRGRLALALAFSLVSKITGVGIDLGLGVEVAAGPSLDRWLYPHSGVVYVLMHVLVGGVV